MSTLICDLENYFLYIITHDDSDAKFSNNLNIFICILNIVIIIIKYIFSNKFNVFLNATIF